MTNNAVLKFYDDAVGMDVEGFNDEEKAKLDEVVTNTDSNVYAWKVGSNLTPEESGALLSRYSRTSLTGRRLYLNEFLPNRNRGREFFESWLKEYGDDSIQEMVGGVPVSCEFVSNLAVKDIEDCRMGSYIEKSSRYVFFDKRLPDGSFMYYRDPDIMGSFGDEYVRLMDSLFESYVRYTPAMIDYIKGQNRLEDQTFRLGDASVKISGLTSELAERNGVTDKDLVKAYENAVKANALDFVRDYLPMSTLTHVGISMNARSYENLMLKMMASPLAESRHIGNRIYEELYKVMPSLVQRTKDEHGMEFIGFLSQRSASTMQAVAGLISGMRPNESGERVDLLDYTGKGSADPDREAQVAIAAAILHRYGSAYSMRDAMERANALTRDELRSLLDAYMGRRKDRRHKPGRAFENVDYLFGLQGRVGIYRDLQRHRVGTQERQNFDVRLGFKAREAFREIGIADDYESKMAEAITLFKRIYERMPYQAQYVVPYGSYATWYYRFNARQLFHFCELRTTPAGHPDYRRLVQKVYGAVQSVHPSIAGRMTYINMSEKTIGRLDSEIRIAMKRSRQVAPDQRSVAP